MDQSAPSGPFSQSRRFSANVAALCSAALLSACAVHSPPAIHASTGAAQGVSSVEFVSDASDAGLRKQFGEALAASFQAHGFSSEKGAASVADYSIGLRPASTSLDGHNANDAAQVRSASRGKVWTDRCEAQRLRATLVVYRRSDGSPAYRGEAESQDCDISDATVNALAELLVQDMLGSRGS